MISGSTNSVSSSTSYCNHCKTSDVQAKQELTDEEKKQVKELKNRDQEVKSHEAAHIAAGGAYVRGGASYSYQSGPDGRRYAVGGEVSIDTSPVSDDPKATITKMQTVKRAALAPAEPSGQDRSVAAQAGAAEAAAQKELLEQKNGSSNDAQTKKVPIDKIKIDKNESKKNNDLVNYNSDARIQSFEKNDNSTQLYA
jgi:hypothetical protein